MGKRKRRGKDKLTKQRKNPSWKDIVKENELMENYYKVDFNFTFRCLFSYDSI